jgi:hypothetical protein
MVMLFVGCGCVAETRKNILFLRRKTYGGIVFVPARRQIAVTLLSQKHHLWHQFLGLPRLKMMHVGG